MGWYVERVGASATRVDLRPEAGDIVVSYDQPTGIFTALNGSRSVWQTPASPVTVQVPKLYFESQTEVNRLKALAVAGVKLTLGTDTGQTYTVRIVNGVRWSILDTADRATKPRFSVTVQLVGV